MFAQAAGGNGLTLNMINATGVQEIWNNNSTDNLAVTNLQEKAAIGVKAGNGGNTTVAAAATARTGDLTVKLDGANAGNLFVTSDGTKNAVGYTSVIIDTATGNNAITGAAGTA